MNQVRTTRGQLLDDAEYGKLGACTPARVHDPMYGFVGKVHLSVALYINLVSGYSENKKKEWSASDNHPVPHTFLPPEVMGGNAPPGLDDSWCGCLGLGTTGLRSPLHLLPQLKRVEGRRFGI